MPEGMALPLCHYQATCEGDAAAQKGCMERSQKRCRKPGQQADDVALPDTTYTAVPRTAHTRRQPQAKSTCCVIMAIMLKEQVSLPPQPVEVWPLP